MNLQFPSRVIKDNGSNLHKTCKTQYTLKQGHCYNLNSELISDTRRCGMCFAYIYTTVCAASPCPWEESSGHKNKLSSPLPTTKWYGGWQYSTQTVVVVVVVVVVVMIETLLQYNQQWKQKRHFVNYKSNYTFRHSLWLRKEHFIMRGVGLTLDAARRGVEGGGGGGRRVCHRTEQNVWGLGQNLFINFRSWPLFNRNNTTLVA